MNPEDNNTQVEDQWPETLMGCTLARKEQPLSKLSLWSRCNSIQLVRSSCSAVVSYNKVINSLKTMKNLGSGRCLARGLFTCHSQVKFAHRRHSMELS
jgi:hypothetical protein